MKTAQKLLFLAIPAFGLLLVFFAYGYQEPKTVSPVKLQLSGE